MVKCLDFVFSSQQSPPQKPSQFASPQSQMHSPQPNGADLEPQSIDPAQKDLLYDLFRLDHVRKVFAAKLAKQKLTGTAQYCLQ